MDSHTRLLLGLYAGAAASGAVALGAVIAVAGTRTVRWIPGSGRGKRVLVATLRRRVLPFFASLGPYALIELILPGGTVIALLLWLYHHRHDPDPLLAPGSTATAPPHEELGTPPEPRMRVPARVGHLLLPADPRGRPGDESWRLSRW